MIVLFSIIEFKQFLIIKKKNVLMITNFCNSQILPVKTERVFFVATCLRRKKDTVKEHLHLYKRLSLRYNITTI